jgi:ArsR family transcriptional regulator, arsenate/arsenite/antimonite-responsive transcriptional repressor
METSALAAFQALAHPDRLRAFRLLVQTGSEGLAAGQIALRLGLPASTLSGHLADLVAARLVRGTRRGRSISYAADTEGIRAWLSFVLTDCCGGRPETCAPILDRLSCAC